MVANHLFWNVLKENLLKFAIENPVKRIVVDGRYYSGTGKNYKLL